jgi:membrane protease YdiL (CAAX protease family)
MLSRRNVEIALYLAITFGITWSLAIVVLGFPGWYAAHFGQLSRSSPLFYIAVWAPNVAALALTATRGGLPALRDLFSRFGRVRVQSWVWLAALTFYPLLMLVVQLVGTFLGRPLAGPDVWLHVAAGLFAPAALFLGPLGEELGWRGYLLPRVLERFSPLAAALIVGTIWMIWHVPAFLASGLPQSGMVFPIFALGGMALSVFVTWLFVNARQSILVAGVVPHMIVNAYGDATGPMTWINAGVLVVGAVGLAAVLGPRLGASEPTRSSEAGYDQGRH